MQHCISIVYLGVDESWGEFDEHFDNTGDIYGRSVNINFIYQMM